MSKKEKKALCDAANYERQRTECIVVMCDEVASLTTKRLDRLAQKLGVSRKRKTGVCGWEDVRTDVVAAWPADTASITLDGL